MARTRPTGLRWLVALVLAAVTGLTLVGCARGTEVSVSTTGDPVCDAVTTIAGVWATAAPPTLLGDPDALADFASGLEGGFGRAVAVLAAEVPDEVATDLAGVEAALTQQYRDGVAYAGGDMSAVPLITPAERTALAGVRDWSVGRCPEVSW